MNSKQKGKRGEAELVNLLNEKFGSNLFRRTPFSGAFVGGKNREVSEKLDYKEGYASDVITPASFKFIIEHKFYESMNFWDLLSGKSNWNEWIEQAEGDAKFVNKIPLLVIKYNRHQRIALVSYTYIISYASRYTDAIPLAKRFIWKGYSVVWLEDLLKLPREFWFTEEEGENG